MYRFADCELDVPRRELRRDGRPVHLEPQAFDLLAHLVEQRDRVVSKLELLDGVWGTRFVSESNLTTRVKEIRRAVGDDGTRQHVVANVRGRGYRFVAPVEDVDEPRRSLDMSHLVGRDDERREVAELTARHPLVTLVGPGGVGKTALARAVARTPARRFEHGVHFVDLAAVSSGGDILPSIASSVDVVLDGDRTAHVIRSIARLDALVVLDNCEHVVTAVAAVANDLANVPDARIHLLATSRVRLGLSHEQLVALGPLDDEHAFTLFAARVRAAGRAGAIDDVDRTRIDHLLAGLDRLPLTIEMAAARVGSMSFDEVEAALSPDEQLLQLTHRTPDRRHRTVSALVAWSADLLEQRHHDILLDCSVFAGPFSAEDAARITDEATTPRFELAELAEQSLLYVDHPGPPTRYRMLDTVRSAAAGWLRASGREERLRRCHAQLAADVAAEVDRLLRGPDEARGRERLDEVVAELRSAQGWARRHAPGLAAQICGGLHLAAYSTFWSEPAGWGALLLGDHAGGRTDLDGARVAVAAAAANRGALDQARLLADIVVHGDGDPRWLASAVEVLTDVAIYAGRLDDATRLSRLLDEHAQVLGDAHLRAIAAVDAALALVFGGDPAAAVERLDRLDPTGLSPSDTGWVQYTRAEIASATGDPVTACEHFAGAAEVARRVGNPFVVSVAQTSLATELTRLGRTHLAIDVFASALADYVRHGNLVHAIGALRNLVELLVRIGDERTAVVLAAATSGDDARPMYGADAARLSSLLDDVAHRLGPDRFEEWSAEGHALDLDAAVLRASRRLTELRR